MRPQCATDSSTQARQQTLPAPELSPAGSVPRRGAITLSAPSPQDAAVGMFLAASMKAAQKVGGLSQGLAPTPMNRSSVTYMVPQPLQ